MSDIGSGTAGRAAEAQVSAVAGQAAVGRTAGINSNAVLAIVAVAQFMVILDASIVNVALPTSRVTSGSRSRASPGS